MKHHHPTAAELPDQPPADALAVQFLRALRRLGSADDPHTGSIIRRVEADVLELIIRKKRQELGAKNG